RTGPHGDHLAPLGHGLGAAGRPPGPRIPGVPATVRSGSPGRGSRGGLQPGPSRLNEGETMSRTAARLTLPRPTDRLPLGMTGLSVSPFCLGIVESPETIPAAFDAGINLFFLTADLHWPLYEGLRRGLEQLFARGGS